MQHCTINFLSSELYSMKYIHIILLLLISTSTYAKQINLFIMAGQSNMQGWRSNAARYPADPHHNDAKIPFYFEALNYSSSKKKWQTLSPQAGHFRAGHFGPEITFARAAYNAHLNPAIFKYSSGSSSLKYNWKAPGHHGMYDDMITNLKRAIQNLKAQGHTVVPRAIIWIQGESDAKNNQLANEYYGNLKRMLHHLRSNVLRKPRLPVILSVDEQHHQVKAHPQVVDAQIRLSMEDSSIVFVSMFGLEKSDGTHLTARGTIQQGKEIYKAFRDF